MRGAFGEGIQPWGGQDPDDLASLLCASLRKAGLEPRVSLRFEGKSVTSIDVHHGDRLIARLPCYPMQMGDELAQMIAATIEAAGHVVSSLE